MESQAIPLKGPICVYTYPDLLSLTFRAVAVAQKAPGISGEGLNIYFWWAKQCEQG